LDPLVYPLQLRLELLERECHRPEHPEPAGLAHLDDDVAAVREGEDGNVDP